MLRMGDPHRQRVCPRERRLELVFETDNNGLLSGGVNVGKILSDGFLS